MILPPLARQSLGSSDVACLRPLVATAQQNDQCRAIHHKVQSISRSEMDPELAHPVPHGCRVAKYSESKAPQSGCDQQLRLSISQARVPLCEGLGLD
jgi:hypothetical protein